MIFKASYNLKAILGLTLVLLTTSCGPTGLSTNAFDQAGLMPSDALRWMTASEPLSVPDGRWKSEWTAAARAELKRDTKFTTSVPTDFTSACPRYFQLTQTQQVDAIVFFLYAMSIPESNLVLTTRLRETSMGKDVVTGNQIFSEGLLQTSYQDSRYHGCPYDWESDKNLAATDPKKSIFQADRQLACGLKILKNQFAAHGRVFPPKPYYWWVLNPNSKGYRIIVDLMKSHKACY